MGQTDARRWKIVTRSRNDVVAGLLLRLRVISVNDLARCVQVKVDSILCVVPTDLACNDRFCQIILAVFARRPVGRWHDVCACKCHLSLFLWPVLSMALSLDLSRVISFVCVRVCACVRACACVHACVCVCVCVCVTRQGQTV